MKCMGYEINSDIAIKINIMWELIYIISGAIGVLLGLGELFDSHMPLGTLRKKVPGIEKRQGELVPVKVRSEGFRFRK